MSAQEIYNIVLKSKLVSKERLDDAFNKAQATKQPLSDVLVSEGLLTGEFLAREIAKSLKIPYVDLDTHSITNELSEIIPENMCEQYKAVAFDAKKNEIFVAVAKYPVDELEVYLKSKGYIKVHFFYADERSINKSLRGLKLAQTGGIASLTKKPAVDVLNDILNYAVYLKASDVHVERFEKEVVIRFRIDGILKEMANLPVGIYAELVSRVKILSNLKLDEKLKPQDGRFTHKFGEEKVDLRISILPANYGECIVLRLLAAGARPRSLSELGFSSKHTHIINAHLKDSFGMILTTGPTGSGKTTTLYSLINLINVPEVKVCTIEDPVEYSLQRAVQIQVNRQADLTFASGLRSLLRHDPDIMMVGEIRDPETADLAINAALTGHLVFSTLHTNNAIGFRDRLVDLDSPPFLISSTATLVIAQRLVRKVCKKCTASYKPSDEAVKLAEKISGKKLKNSRFFKGRGCAFCGQTGFSGRLGIYEVLEITPKIQVLIAQKEHENKIIEEAKTNGFTNMALDGIEKAEAGETTLEEVLRVVGKA